MSWEIIEPGLHFLRNSELTTTQTLHIFDFDGTIIKNIIWQDPQHPVINKPLIEKLRELPYFVVISNQYKVNPKVLTAIAKVLSDFNCDIYVASEENNYRKPNTGVIELLLSKFQGVQDIIYVGDAAGRFSDFSDSDRKFAFNMYLYCKFHKLSIKVKFYTPEEYVSSTIAKVKKEWRGIYPKDYIQVHKPEEESPKHYVNEIIDFVKNHTEKQMLVILIGAPASGKDYIADTIVKKCKNFKVIAQDVLKTKAKCISLAQELLKQKCNVIINRTNPTPEDRATFINLAKNINPNIYVLGINLNFDRDICEHLNVVRSRISDISRIPKVVYNVYYKKYVIPEAQEGYNHIIHVNNFVYSTDFINKSKLKEHLLSFLQFS